MVDGSSTSIGQQDQMRDRDMLREERQQQSLKEDAESSVPNAWPAGGAPPKPAPPGAEDREQEWQPGDPEQPDRASSDGLTGSGPAQPA